MWPCLCSYPHSCHEGGIDWRHGCWCWWWDHWGHCQGSCWDHSLGQCSEGPSMAHPGRILRNRRQLLPQLLTANNRNCKSNPTNSKLVRWAVLFKKKQQRRKHRVTKDLIKYFNAVIMSLPGGQLMLVPLEIFSLGLLPWPQLSGGTRGLVGDSEVDIRL